MNEIVNKFLLNRDKFMPEMHLEPPNFTYSVCGPFTKNKERIQQFMQTGNTDYIYKNDLDKACFQHDMAYGKYKDLAKRAESDKLSMVYKFFNKKSAGSGVATLANKFMSNGLLLANELHKPVIRKFKRKSLFII